MVVNRIPVLSYFLWCTASIILLVKCEGDVGGTILSPYIKSSQISLARTLSTVDPKHFLGVESYSGFITVKEKYDSNSFFWYFPHSSAKDVPWVIWLQGGPGVSSLLGVFDGIGPLMVENGKLKLRELTWASDYSLLFVDNPVGGGFSYTSSEQGYTTNEEDVSEQLYEFLDQFLCIFPELRKAPLFIAGESYGGKYVPAFASYIHRHKRGDINLRGIAIGNGLIDPKSQLSEGHHQLCDVLGIMEDKDLATLKQVQQECLENIEQGKMVAAANKFNESIEFIKSKSGINIYNFELDPSKSAPPFEEFVTRAEVRKRLHVGNSAFDFNNQRVYQAMLPDIMNTTMPFVEELLEHYGVMCYVGQLDIILPYSLAKSFYAQLRWSRREEYDHATRKRTRSAENKNVVAYRKSGGNFVDVLVRHAGHQATKEQPRVCKYIMDSFIEEFKQ